MQFWEKFPRRTIEQFQSALPGNNVLNVGSGSGRDALLLRDAGLHITCLDASAAMVAMTKKLGFPTIHADFAHLDLSDYTFDGVWAYTSLIHVSSEELRRTVDYLRTLLPRNGVLLLGLIQGTGVSMVQRSSMPDTERYFRYYQAPEIDELMHGLGFKLIFSEEYQPNTTAYLNRLYQL